jgi:hypothetical protein
MDDIIDQLREAADEIKRLRTQLAMNELVKLSEELGLYERQETEEADNG